jgi:hypothetical protein
MELHVSERVRRVLERLAPARKLDEAIDELATELLRARLRDSIEELGHFEAKHGCTFEQFAANWHAERIPDRSSHENELEFMEWEALTMERQELLSELHGLLSQSSGGA